MTERSPPLSEQACKNNKRLGCPFSKYYPEDFDAKSPCTDRWGFNGFRCLNEHIRKYHSYQFSCELCRKGFPEASLNERSEKYLHTLKAKHRQEVHANRADSNDDPGAGVVNLPFKRQRKAAGSEVSPGQIGLHPDTESVGSPGRHNKRRRQRRAKATAKYPPRMTPSQDEDFKNWKEDPKKSTEAKYASLCRCLFGDKVPLPASPYYDYLIASHEVDKILQSRGLPTIARLRAAVGSLELRDGPEPERTSSPGPSAPSAQQRKRLAVPPQQTRSRPIERDPYFLGDSAASAPSNWSIPGGPDSGFMSKDSDLWPEGRRATTPPEYVADHAEGDDDSRPPLHDILGQYDVLQDGLDPRENNMFNSITVSGVSLEELGSLPHSLDVDDMINYDLDEHGES